MDYNRMRSFIEENSEVIEFGAFGEGVSNEWIEKAQKRLNVNFPPSYVWWLKNYGGGAINGEEIFSIYELDFDSVIGGDIVYINELNLKNGAVTKQQLTIQENDQGESYFINLNIIDKYGESPVYVDLNNSKYAENFFDFLIKKTNE